MPKRKRPGSPKGQAKPLKRVLDADFHERFTDMIGDRSEEGIIRIATAIGCSPQHIYNCVTSGKKGIEALFLFDVCDYFEVNPRWLLKGEGEKFSPYVRPKGRRAA